MFRMRGRRMNEPKTPTVFGFVQPHGTCIKSEHGSSLKEVSHDLCRIASHLQWLDPFIKLVRVDDWYNHDGLYFERGPTDFYGLFQLIQSPRELMRATPDDDYVHVAVVPENRRWYLRFRAEWDEPGETLIGHYSVTLCDELLDRFEAEITPDLQCPIRRAAPGEEWESRE
jgi:hypothetical protein